jgi:hypothetical protein
VAAAILAALWHFIKSGIAGNQLPHGAVIDYPIFQRLHLCGGLCFQYFKKSC